VTEIDRNAEIRRNSETGELRRKGEFFWQRPYEIGRGGSDVNMLSDSCDISFGNDVMFEIESIRFI
jgi:hypothetical protein